MLACCARVHMQVMAHMCQRVYKKGRCATLCLLTAKQRNYGSAGRQLEEVGELGEVRAVREVRGVRE